MIDRESLIDRVHRRVGQLILSGYRKGGGIPPHPLRLIPVSV